MPTQQRGCITAILILNVLVALIALKLLIELFAILRSAGGEGGSYPTPADDECSEPWVGLREQEFPIETGNLPTEEYSSAAGSRSSLGDFRDPVDEFRSGDDAIDEAIRDDGDW